MFTKNNQLIILGFFLAVLTGLGIGYLLFHSDQKTEMNASVEHVHEAESVWTCSMHPQIRSNEPGECPICGMDLIQLSSSTSSDPLVLEMTPEAVKLANIQTTIIGSATKSDKTLILSGKIQADERLAASQVAHIPGRIEKLYVTFKGETVRRGQKLATIYSPELVTAQQELLQAIELKETNPGLLEAARKKLEYWKIPVEQIREIEESGKIQENFDLRADVSGIVKTRRVSVGDHLKQGEVLFDVVNLNRLWVLFDAYEEDLADIKVGNLVEFSTPALAGEIFTTRISFIDPVINPQTRVASVRGEIINRNGLLKPEMFVRGILKSSVSKDAQLLVPQSSVLWTGKRSVVYIKVPGNAPAYRYQEVVLGDRVGNNYLVESGLNSGDEIVTYGSFTIDAAAQLNNQQSMMNQWVNVEEETPEIRPDYKASTSEVFQQQLGEFVQTYIDFKDALVETNLEKSIPAAEKMAIQLKKIDMSLLQGEAHIYWMKQLRILEAHTEKILASQDIKEQRKQFLFLSTGLINAVSAFGITGERTLYVQHCPMAMNDKGADWLSYTENILNPYFGEEMLTCGIVKEELNSAKNEKPVN